MFDLFNKSNLLFFLCLFHLVLIVYLVNIIIIMKLEFFFVNQILFLNKRDTHIITKKTKKKHSLSYPDDNYLTILCE